MKLNGSRLETIISGEACEPLSNLFLRLRVHMLGILRDTVPADRSRSELGTQNRKVEHTGRHEEQRQTDNQRVQW